MKYSAILTSLILSVSLFSLNASAFSSRNTFDTRDWPNDRILTRREGYGAVDNIISRDNLVASLTTRALVNELEARLVRRAPNPSPTTPVVDPLPPPDATGTGTVALPQPDTGSIVPGSIDTGGTGTGSVGTVGPGTLGTMNTGINGEHHSHGHNQHKSDHTHALHTLEQLAPITPGLHKLTPVIGAISAIQQQKSTRRRP